MNDFQIVIALNLKRVLVELDLLGPSQWWNLSRRRKFGLIFFQQWGQQPHPPRPPTPPPTPKRAPDGKPLFVRTPIKGSNPRKRASETPQWDPPSHPPDLGSKSEVKIIVCNIFLE